MNNMKIYAGYGAAILPSPIGQDLSGYGYYLERKCTDILDDLYVRAAVIRGSVSKSVILSLDLIGLDEKTAERSRALVEEVLGFSQQEILLVCTHTHTGPATNYLEGCGEVDEEYLGQIPNYVLCAAEHAVKNCSIVTKIQECVQVVDKPVGYNRVRVDGIHDNYVRGLLLSREKAASIALVSYPCHPVTLGPVNKSSADYPGAVCKLFAAQGVNAVFLNGCCGDIDPISNRIKWGSGTEVTLREYAEIITSAFQTGLRDVESIDIKTIEFDVILSLQPLTEKKIFEVAQTAPVPEVADVWKKKMLKSLPIVHEITIPIRAVKVGHVVFCGVPFETYTCVGEEARTLLNNQNLVVLGCADWTRSYLPDIHEGEEKNYAALDAAMLYGYPLIMPGEAVHLGHQIGLSLRNIYEA